MTIPSRDFYEIKAGPDGLRYLISYGLLTLLAKRAAKRPQKMFVQIASNIDRHILSEGLFEKGIIDLLAAVAQDTGRTELLIDVGANIGNHSVALSGVFSNVESVEPHPVLFKILEANVLTNGLTNVTCHPFGLAGSTVEATLSESAQNHGLSRVRERSVLPPEVFGLSVEQFDREFSVSLHDAAEFVGQYGEKLDRALIKIDVEGMELEIVAALMPLLRERRPVIAFEWYTVAQPKFVELARELPNYELWGIDAGDVGQNLLWRAIKLMFRGRSYRIDRLDPDRLDPLYPLAFLIPSEAA